MKRKAMVSGLLRVGLSLAVVFVLAMGIAYADREQPGPQPKGSGADKLGLATERSEPNKIPYVGPQNKNDGPSEDGGSYHLAPASELFPGDPEGGKSGRAMAGLAWSTAILAISASWPPTCNRPDVSLAIHSDNTQYIAFLSHWNSDDSYNTFVRVEYSSDGGLTWNLKGSVAFDPTDDLIQPSIALTNDTIVVAYVVVPTTGYPYVEVATCPMSGSTFTAHSILHNESPVDYGMRPKLWTDCNIYPSSSSVYLAYEWYVGGSSTNVNAVFQRSGDDGATWKDRYTWIGNTSSDTFITPSGCFGEGNYHMLYVTAFDQTTKTVYLVRSSDWGVTPGVEQAVYTMTNAPNLGNANVRPGIAAATAAGSQNAILAFCLGYNTSGDDDIWYVASSDNGATWSGPYGVPGGTSTGQEVAPVAVASPDGGGFHVAFTEYASTNFLTYSQKPSSGNLWTVSGVRVNRGGVPSATYPCRGLVASYGFDFPTVGWTDFGYDTTHGYYNPRCTRLVPDDLVGSWTGQGVYYRSDVNSWYKLGSPATQVTVGDLDGDDTADVIGVWPSQAGAWIYKSTDKTWVLLGSTPVDIGAGDMDGNGSEDFVATWDGQGVYYKTAIAGSWVKLASPATMIAAGDLDDDGIDDIAGVWPGQGGVWVKYSATGTWAKLSSTAVHIACGDMNGDGRDDLLGTWDGQGVYYRDSVRGTWVKMASPATMIATGDLDGDDKDDLIGIWPAQAGVWVKYSTTAAWAYISSSAADIAAGKVRGGTNTWGATAAALAEPMGGAELGGPLSGRYLDLFQTGPGGSDFVFRSPGNLEPANQGSMLGARPGPGDPGFACEEQENLEPGQVEDHERNRRTN